MTGQNGNGAARVSNLFEQTPLLDMELEGFILGTLIIHPHFLKELDLTERDFASQANRTVWNAIVAVYANDDACDTHLLQAHLAESGKLANVGGLEYLLSLTDTVISSTPPTAHAARLKRLAIQRRLREVLVFHAKHVQDPDRSAKYRAEIDRLHEQLDALSENKVVVPQKHRLDDLWLTVGERGSLSTAPAPRQWLLQRPDEETNRMGNPIGVLPLGKTGLLVAQGGSGKTIALIQLAISVATGRRWLDHYIVPRPGRVLLALAEEDGEELDRRIYDIAQSMRLTDLQCRQVADNIVALGLAGEVTSLVVQDGRETVETDVLTYFRRRLNEGEWSLVVLDTLARFAGGDTEKDSAQATRFIQAAESLCKTPGRPTVLIAHHTNKISRAEGAATSASNARGSSALTDGARWVANLEATGDGAVKFTITKSNYAPEAPAVTLQRSQEHGGCLSVLSHAAVVQQADRQLERIEKLIPDILELLTKRPGLSKGEIRDRLLTKRSDAYAAVDHMKRTGLLVEKPKNAYSVAPNEGGPG